MTGREVPRAGSQPGVARFAFLTGWRLALAADMLRETDATVGSVANVNSIQSGAVESGFVQSDVAYWAFTGTGLYEGKPKADKPKKTNASQPSTKPMGLMLRD